MVYIIYLIIAVAVILNIIATYVVFHTHFEVKARRVYQTLLSWLIPYFGAILVIYINREDYFYERQLKKNKNGFSSSNYKSKDYSIPLSHVLHK